MMGPVAGKVSSQKPYAGELLALADPWQLICRPSSEMRLGALSETHEMKALDVIYDRDPEYRATFEESFRKP